MSGAPRHDYALLVSRELRRSIEELLCSRSIRDRKGRVFLAVLHQTAGWSRVGAWVSEDTLAELARIPGEDSRHLRTWSALRELADEGRLFWEPGQRGGAAGYVGLVALPQYHQLPTRAVVRNRVESKKQTGSNRPGFKPGQIDPVNEDVRVIDDEKFAALIAPLTPVASQVAEARAAYAEDPAGVAECVAIALERGRTPAALFMSLIRSGAHTRSQKRSPKERALTWASTSGPMFPPDDVDDILEQFGLSLEDKAEVTAALERAREQAA